MIDLNQKNIHTKAYLSVGLISWAILFTWLGWLIRADRAFYFQQFHEFTTGQIIKCTDQRVKFSSWTNPDSGSWRWSEGKSADIKFRFEVTDNVAARYTISVTASALDSQRVNVLLNNKILGELKMNECLTTYILSIPGGIMEKNDLNTLRFMTPDAHMPSNGDTRLLGIALRELHFQAIQ